MSTVENQKTAKLVIKALTQFFLEFEASQTIANMVYMNLDHYKSLLQCFPWMITKETSDDSYANLNYNGRSYRIYLTNKDTVGVGFSFFTDHLGGFNDKTIKEGTNS